MRSEHGRALVCSQCGQRYDQGEYCANDGQALVATEDPLLGSEVGRYRLARLLGEGGMGRVYLAVHPAIGSRVAVKVLSDPCARNPELLERFFAEARAVNLIRHESIVSVIDLAQLPDGRPYIVMEYVEGQTLAALAHAGPVPLGGMVQVMSEVLSALAAAHAIGIVHRDLKPDNVLVTAEGHAKVLDFGIAKLAPELHQQLSPRTGTGALLGTPRYMAPEQIRGGGVVDARTDLYAAGVVLYELATGRPPFVGETLFDLMRAHLEEPPRPPRALRPELPAALEQVILTALSKPPEARFASAAAMIQALQAAAAALPAEQWRSLSARSSAARGPASGAGIPLAYQPTRAVGPAPTIEGGRRIWLVIGAVVAAAIAVAVVLFVVTGGPPGMAGSSTELAGTGSAPEAPGTAGSAIGELGSGAPRAGSASAGSATKAETSGSAVRRKTAGTERAATPVATPPAPRVAGSPAQVPPTTPGRPAPSAAAPSDAGAGPGSAGGGSTVDPGGTPGPNVTIGAATPAAPAGRTSIRRPADYDPRRFDPVAYLPKALRLARELLPDAQLTSFEFDPVFSDGRVDLTIDGRDRSYELRSPARSAFPAGRPRNLPLERACRVSVEIGAGAVSARVLTSEDCDAPLVRAPRCSFASVWKQALARGTPGDLVARIGWMSDGTWFFDTDLADRGGGVSSFADRCP